MCLYAYSGKHVLGINYGEGISARSVMFLFHLLPVKVLNVFFLCLFTSSLAFGSAQFMEGASLKYCCCRGHFSCKMAFPCDSLKHSC